MPVAEHELMSAAEFLDWIEGQDDAFELVDGFLVRMMTGARESHNVTTTNIVLALAPGAKTRKCRTTSGDTAVRTGPNGVRYPDVVVDCGPRDPSAKEASRPVVVVEVASPNTVFNDHTDKLDEYRAHDGIQVAIFVEPDVVSVKLYRRDEAGLWHVEKYDDLGDVIDLAIIGSTLSLKDVYDTLEPKTKPRLKVVRDDGDASAGPKPG